MDKQNNLQEENIMKRLIVALGFVAFLGNSSISIAEEILQKEPSQHHSHYNCKKVCVEWEEKTKCKPAGGNPEVQTCETRPICIKYGKECYDGPTL
jgi:hypothetical protein